MYEKPVTSASISIQLTWMPRGVNLDADSIDDIASEERCPADQKAT